MVFWYFLLAQVTLAIVAFVGLSDKNRWPEKHFAQTTNAPFVDVPLHKTLHPLINPSSLPSSSFNYAPLPNCATPVSYPSPNPQTTQSLDHPPPPHLPPPSPLLSILPPLKKHTLLIFTLSIDNTSQICTPLSSPPIPPPFFPFSPVIVPLSYPFSWLYPSPQVGVCYSSQCFLCSFGQCHSSRIKALKHKCRKLNFGGSGE